MVKKINGSGASSTTGHVMFSTSSVTTGHGLENMASSANTQYIIDTVVSDLKECIEANAAKNTQICEIVMAIQAFQLENAQGFVPIEESDLLDIYESFIKPYVECEIYLMGGINDVIRLHKIIDDQIAIATTERAKLMLKILKDIMTAIINARNDKVGLIQYKNQVSNLESKYNECKIEVINLRDKIERLLNEEPTTYGVFRGKLGMSVKNLKPMIYSQARFDIDRAWYQFLYPGCSLDPEKYQATIIYVRSFGTLKNAYDTLVTLLDQHFASMEDDIDSAEKSLKIEEIKE